MEYIGLKTPVSSKLLSNKYRFGIKPSTMRIEFQKLTELGYLHQPYTSAGRVPTDKGYRFYVDNLQPKPEERNLTSLEKEMEDSFRFFQHLTQRVAELTSSLTLTYFPEEDIVFKEGWDEIFKEPEFSDSAFISRFMETVQNFEKHFEEFTNSEETRVLIGKENQLPAAQDFSAIVSKIHLPQKKQGVVAILGLKRMAYDKNVGIMESLLKLWKI